MVVVIAVAARFFFTCLKKPQSRGEPECFLKMNRFVATVTVQRWAGRRQRLHHITSLTSHHVTSRPNSNLQPTPTRHCPISYSYHGRKSLDQPSHHGYSLLIGSHPQPLLPETTPIIQ